MTDVPKKVRRIPARKIQKLSEDCSDLGEAFVGCVLDFFFGVVFAEAEPDGVVPPVFVVGDGLENV